MAFSAILVDNASGVELSYLDSGAPSYSPYTTIFAVHGMIFTSAIFSKVIDIAASNDIRFVAINRRAFPGSTSYTPEELRVVTNPSSTQSEKDAFMEARGHEIAIFIDTFIQKFDLPPLSADGMSGGVAILGWSIGSSHAAAAVASSSTLPSDIRARLSRYLRSLIFYEAAPMIIGLPPPPQSWLPLTDEQIPRESRLLAFAQWATSFFDHGDLSTRNLDQLSWVVASPNHIPTFFTFGADVLKTVATFDDLVAGVDVPYTHHFSNQLSTVYRKAFFSREIADIFPHLKRSILCGDKTGAFGIAGLWAVQDDETVFGGWTRIEYKLAEGINHFIHWVDPEKALRLFMDLL
ncbi:hypothetical protein Moror_10314 [Moniliophthora roreri MCA 2997]|uniref:Uncharacterized protein n=2 Tax=Moniliophthora roreri TaxID=221103 RepID=V2XHN7_MONRO|nr:hypothetical protein Moror_10314 [Moniliophthora roreri MCA 2997]KAI3609615.1 hypothetical protein WG66_001254 [Moniliophthora roreri]